MNRRFVITHLTDGVALALAVVLLTLTIAEAASQPWWWTTLNALLGAGLALWAGLDLRKGLRRPATHVVIDLRMHRAYGPFPADVAARAAEIHQPVEVENGPEYVRFVTDRLYSLDDLIEESR